VDNTPAHSLELWTARLAAGARVAHRRRL